MEDTHKTNLEKYIGKGKVFIFSKSYCPYCDQAKDLLDALGIKHTSTEVDQKTNEFSDAFVQYVNTHAGVRTYPKVYVGEKCIGGFSELQKSADSMKLFALLKAEGIAYDDA